MATKEKKTPKPKKPKKKVEIDLRKLPADERGKAFSGQSAEARAISFEELSKGEQKLLGILNGEGKGLRPIVPIADMSKGSRLTPLGVRNTLRRLVPSKWIENVHEGIDDEGEVVKLRGHYRITESGRKRFANAA